MALSILLKISIWVISLFTLLFPSGNSYILDAKFPLIYTYQENEVGFSHFGASVALAPGPIINEGDGDFKKPYAWLFVGAPTGNNSYPQQTRAGVIWRCSIGQSFRTRGGGTETCEILDIDPDPTKPRNKPRRSEDHDPMQEEYINSWTGVTLNFASQRMVTCAHRYSRGNRLYMNGICYFLRYDKDSKTSIDKDKYSHRLHPFFAQGGNLNDLEQYFNYTKVKGDNPTDGLEWGVGQVGVSSHILKDGKELLLGAPGARSWSGAIVKYADEPFQGKPRPNLLGGQRDYTQFVVAHRGTRLYWDPKNNHWFDYFGYSVTSGKFFENGETLYVGGSPRADHLDGEVVIFKIPGRNPSDRVTDYKRQIETILEIEQPDNDQGSYFGAVLLSTDLNGDGLDELLVGAPFHSSEPNRRNKRSTGEDEVAAGGDNSWPGDQGSVFVYNFSTYTDNRNQSQKNKTLHCRLQPEVHEGSAYGRFGSSISILYQTDRNGTKIPSIVVGAPNAFGRKGVVYIFDNNCSLKQTIRASDISEKLSGFGSSLSTALDMDSNGTPDIAIGSLNSSQVVVLRTRSNLFLRPLVTFLDPNRKQKDKKVGSRSTEVLIKPCVDAIFTTAENTTEKVVIDVDVSLFLDRRFSTDQRLNYTQSISLYSGQQLVECTIDWIHLKVVNITGIPKTQPYEVTQKILFPDRSDGELRKNFTLEYVFHDRKSQTIQSDFQHLYEYDFQPGLPYPTEPVSETFYAERSDNDCASVVCKPNLKFTNFWLNETNFTLSRDVELGLHNEIVLRILVHNEGEVALTPNYNIKFPEIGVRLKHNLLPTESGCSYSVRRDFGVSYAIYNCKLPYDISKDKDGHVGHLDLRIPFDLSQVPLNMSTAHNFTVTYSFRQADYGTRTQWTEESSWINLYVGSTLRVALRALKREIILAPTMEVRDYENSTLCDGSLTVSKPLYAMSRQNYVYKVSVEGFGRVRTAVKISFPYAKMDKDSTFPIVLVKKNPRCKDPGQSQRSEFYCPNMPTKENTSIEEQPSYPDVDGTHIIPASITVDNNELHFSKTADDIHLLACGANYSCLSLTCEFVLSHNSPMDLLFDIFIVKDELDALLKTHSGGVLLASYGKATIFEGIRPQHVASNESETYVKLSVPEEVGGKVYIVSIVVGIILMVLIACGLYRCGFFKREQKERLKQLKEETEVRRKSMLSVSKLESVQKMQEAAEMELQNMSTD